MPTLIGRRGETINITKHLTQKIVDFNFKINILYWTLWWAVIKKHNIIKDILSTAPNKGTPYYETHSNYYETLAVKHPLWKDCYGIEIFLIRNSR